MSLLTLSEPRRFIKNLYRDYRKSTTPTKKEKRQAILRTIRLLWTYVWNGLSAPFIYPIWYLFRRQICAQAYRGTTWQEVNEWVQENRIDKVKETIKANGLLIYWLWTYGDLRDPLGRGELQFERPNTFWWRYVENAFRNARFTVNFLEFNSPTIMEVVPSIDERDFSTMVKSMGLGDKPAGIYLVWYKDVKGQWWYQYNDFNKSGYFYIGNVALGNFGRNYSRFEVSYRKTDSTYRVN